MVQNGELKVVKKDNKNHGYGSKGNGSSGGKSQGGQLAIQAPSSNPPSNTYQNTQVNNLA